MRGNLAVECLLEVEKASLASSARENHDKDLRLGRLKVKDNCGWTNITNQRGRESIKIVVEGPSG